MQNQNTTEQAERTYHLIERNNRIINAVIALLQERGQRAMAAGIKNVYCPICSAQRIDYHLRAEELARRDMARRNRTTSLMAAMHLAVLDLKEDRVGSAICGLENALDADGEKPCRKEAM